MKKQNTNNEYNNDIGSDVRVVQKLQRTTQKGITLIALIITIIILLILAMVSIKIIWNGGIITHAQVAANKTNEAMEEEKEKLALLELKMGADDLVKEYPLNCELSDSSDGIIIELLNNNIIDLYEQILKKYDTNYEKLTLSQGIKAANTFYEIYNKEIQNYKNETNEKYEKFIKEHFWERLEANDLIYFKEDSIESQKKLAALSVSFAYSKYSVGKKDSIINYQVTASDGIKYGIVPIKLEGGTETIFSGDGIMEMYNIVFPGGHFSMQSITGTQNSVPNLVESINVFEEQYITKLTQDNINELQFLNFNSEAVENKEEYINKIAFIGEVKGGKLGAVMQNVFVVNSETGEIIYIDDNGEANKLFL